MGKEKKIIYDEQGVTPGADYEKGQWRKIATHSDTEIKGFFGEYRFLSNFWPAKVFLDGEEYSCTENAYQAAKYKKEDREYFKTCSPKESIVFVRENPPTGYSEEGWANVKLEVMQGFLIQKFDQQLNPDNYERLLETGEKYLEETNYWEDTFWGVHKTDVKEDGIGENNLGKLLMEIRENLVRNLSK